MISVLPGIKNLFLSFLGSERLRPWRWSCGLFLLVGAITRLGLLAYTGQDAEATIGMVIAVLLLGVGTDLIAASFFFIPLVLFLAVFPATWHGARIGRAVLLSGMSVWVAVILFVPAAEWIFWDEFGTRFNFIAVDYLVYTHEVIANIWQSYPVVWVVSVIAAISAGLVFWQQSRICARGTVNSWRADLPAVLLILLMPALAWAVVPRRGAGHGNLSRAGICGYAMAARCAFCFP